MYAWSLLIAEMNQPDMVGNPAFNSFQLNWENTFFPVPLGASFGLARRVRPPCPASVYLLSTLRLHLLTHGIPPAFQDGIHFFIPLTVIGSVF